MSRGILLLIVFLAIVVGALVALANIDTTIAPHEVQKDMAGNAATAQ